MNSASAAIWRWSTSSLSVEPDDIELVRDLLIQHAGYTGSAVAKRLLKAWKRSIKEFVKVMPLDYRRVLEEQKTAALADPASDLLQAVEVSRG